MNMLSDESFPDFKCPFHKWLCVQLMRLFVGEPVWTAHNRPQEDHPARREYIKSVTERVGVPLAAHWDMCFLSNGARVRQSFSVCCILFYVGIEYLTVLLYIWRQCIYLFEATNEYIWTRSLSWPLLSKWTPSWWIYAMFRYCQWPVVTRAKIFP